jgi:CheY-like chemotaxis protein
LIQTELTHVEDKKDAFGEPAQGGAYTKVTVSDTGPGIPGSLQPGIFNPLMTTKKGLGKRGAGVGLSIVYRVLTNHCGFVKFRSSAGNTVFELFFRAAQMPAEGDPVGKSNEVPCSEKKILVVDDERTIRHLFNMILSTRMPDFEIEIAANGREALDMFMAGHHSLIVMDLHMPIMDGQAAFFRIRQFCAQKNWVMPPVVFCTGYAPSDSIRTVVSESPEHSLLCKPVTGETLLQTIRSRLQSAQ